jgi:DNA modification methylase
MFERSKSTEPQSAEKRLTTDESLVYEMWPISRPKPNPHNARVHSADQISQLAASMREFGCTRPLLADETDTLLAGHGAWLAAQQAELTEVPVIVRTGLSEQQKRAYLIADNQLAQISTWDEERLRREIAVLEKEVFDMKPVGFSPEELDRILADLPPERIPKDEDDVPAARPQAVTKAGDLLILGPHRVLCGDSLASESFERLLGQSPADMSWCDLPYNVAYRGRSSRKRTLPIANDDLGTEFEGFLRAACEQILAVTRGAVYLCMSSSELHTLHKAFTAAGGHWSTFIIWAKDQFTLGRSDLHRQYEPILYGWREGQEHYWCGSRKQGDVWSIPKPRTNDLHPTMKPVALVERAIRNSSRRGGIVLDAFAGSGSTLIACEKSGRQARLVELEPQYVDVMVRRWEAYTGQVARLEADGSSFAETAERRLHGAA